MAGPGKFEMLFKYQKLRMILVDNPPSNLLLTSAARSSHELIIGIGFEISQAMANLCLHLIRVQNAFAYVGLFV